MTSLVTDSGLSNVMAAWVAYASQPKYLQAGTGSGQGDTAIDVAAPVQTRATGAVSQQTTNVAGDTFRVTGTITATSDVTISELGVFDASSAGSMDIYGDFTGIALAAGDGIVFQIDVAVA